MTEGKAPHATRFLTLGLAVLAAGVPLLGCGESQEAKERRAIAEFQEKQKLAGCENSVRLCKQLRPMEQALTPDYIASCHKKAREKWSLVVKEDGTCTK